MYKTAQILAVSGLLLLSAACRQSEQAPDKASPDTPAARSSSTTPSTEVATGAHHILFFGDSITAGYGLEDSKAFPALIQEKINAAGWRFNVINAGLSGDTSAGGLRRIDWQIQEPVDVFILELGGNDGLRGTSPDATKQNLQAIIDRVREKSPNVRIILAGMQVPPNLGPEHTRRFREIFPELAEENDIDLIPFLLEDVGGIPRLNQSDGIHPTAEGHAIVAETVWKTLEPILADIAENDESCLADADDVESDCKIDMSAF